MNKKIKIAILIITILLVIAFALVIDKLNIKDSENVLDEKIVIAVSIEPQRNFVESIAPDLFKVVTLIPPGYSPENYEPSPKEIQKLNNSKIYFSIGVPTEKENILPNINQNTKIIHLEDIVASKYPDLQMSSGGRDPHIWLSPKRVIVMIEEITRQLCVLDPSNSEVIIKNSKQYIEKLNKLDLKMKNSFEQLNSKKIIVYHPAFGYLADDYNIQMYCLEHDGKEATAKHIKDMVDVAKKENIKIIFYQEEIDSSQSQAFAEEIGGKTVMLSPLAYDYIDNFEKMCQIIKEVIKNEGNN